MKGEFFLNSKGTSFVGIVIGSDLYDKDLDRTYTISITVNPKQIERYVDLAEKMKDKTLYFQNQANNYTISEYSNNITLTAYPSPSIQKVIVRIITEDVSIIVDNGYIKKKW